MIDILGDKRVLDYLVIESGTSTARTISLYKVTSLSELTNFIILVKASSAGQAAATTIKINNLDAKSLKLNINGAKVTPDYEWIGAGEIYALTYDGEDFVAFPINSKSSSPSTGSEFFDIPEQIIGLTTSSTAEEIATALGGNDYEQLMVSAIANNVPCRVTGSEGSASGSFIVIRQDDVNSSDASHQDIYIITEIVPQSVSETEVTNGELTAFAIQLEVNRETYLYTKVNRVYHFIVGRGSTADTATKQYVDDHTAETILTTGVNSSGYIIYTWDGINPPSNSDVANWITNAEKALVYNENEQRHYAISKRYYHKSTDGNEIYHLYLIGDIVGFEPSYDSSHNISSVGLKSTVYQIIPASSPDSTAQVRKFVSRNANASDYGIKELTFATPSYVDNLLKPKTLDMRNVNIDTLSSNTLRQFTCEYGADESALGTNPFTYQDSSYTYKTNVFTLFCYPLSGMIYKQKAVDTGEAIPLYRESKSPFISDGYWPWYSMIEDFYYSPNQWLDKDDVVDYYYRKFKKGKTCTLVGYKGDPTKIHSLDGIKYVCELRNPSTTYLDGFVAINRSIKQNDLELSSNMEYRPDPVAYLTLANPSLGANKIIAGENTAVNITCYSVGLTKLELSWQQYNSSGGITKLETLDITPKTIESGENVIYSTTIKLNNIGTGKILITATYQTIESTSIGQSFEVIQGGEVCFTGDTPVLTSSGLVNIQDLKVGDKVISYNEETKQNEEKAITNIKSHEEYDLYYIITRTDTVRCTYDHPFYVKDKGKVLSRNLRAGDILIDKDGNERRLQSIAYSIDDTETVYDIAVEGNNTYYVGKDSILVYTEDVTKNKFKEEE